MSEAIYTPPVIKQALRKQALPGLMGPGAAHVGQGHHSDTIPAACQDAVCVPVLQM